MTTMGISSFTGANFIGVVGQSFRFQTLGDDGNPLGNDILTGQVRRAYRQGRQVSVDLYIPDKYCTHTYEAKRIYYMGEA